MYLYVLYILIIFCFYYIDFIIFCQILLYFDFIIMILFCDFIGNNFWNYLWIINRRIRFLELWSMVFGVYYCCRREFCWCYYLFKLECSKLSVVVK